VSVSEKNYQQGGIPVNYIFQLMIIFGVSLAGEIIHALLPLPVPASVYGLVLLFILLVTKAVRLEQVEKVSEYMMAVMPLFFIEPTVGVMESYGLVKGKIAVLFLLSFLSFMAVLAVTGLSAQTVIRLKKKGDTKHESE
jgi:holin-like protein